MSYFDSHAHVHDAAFDADRAAVLARARQAGVTGMICIGAGGDMDTVERAVALARSEPDVFATVGVHPHDVSRMEPAWWPALRALAREPRVVGIGETGLDYHYDHSPREVQRRCFGAFVELARELGLPVVCHVRDAHEDARAILAEHRAAELGCIIHCFTGTPADAAAYAAMGMYISFSGVVTFPGKRSDPVRAAVREVPRDRLLIETDCPYLAPAPMRGQRNEPAFVVHTAAAVARELGVDALDLAEITAQNARALFRLPAPGAGLPGEVEPASGAP